MFHLLETENSNPERITGDQMAFPPMMGDINLRVMTRRQFKQLHFALLISSYTSSESSMTGLQFILIGPRYHSVGFKLFIIMHY